jgi:2-dehydropantoate 2-reductase
MRRGEAMTKANYHIVGAGALGMLYGSYLAPHAHITMIVRSATQLRQLRQSGIRLQIEATNECFARNVECFMLGDVQSTPDVIVLTVKQHHLDEALMRQLHAQYGNQVPIICLQNGLGHIERLARYFPAEMVIAAITTEGAMRITDHLVAHTGRGQTSIGPMQLDTQWPSAVSGFINVLLRSGLTADYSDHMETLIWRKLCINACINPLTSLLQCRNGQLLEWPHARLMLEQLCDELVALASHKGLDGFDPLPTWIKEICQATARNESSMLQDVRHARPTEIEAITGSLIAEGERYGLVMATHRRVYRLLQTYEKRLKYGGNYAN